MRTTAILPRLILATIAVLTCLGQDATQPILAHSVDTDAGTECRCAAARATLGWCSVHKIGYIAFVPITSKLLWESLDTHGHDVDPATFHGSACEKAIATDGYCEELRVGFVGKRAYFTRLTYILARGTTKKTDEIACPRCRKNAERTGWCNACGTGMIGAVAIGNKQDYERALDELRIVEKANQAAAKCEPCAVAIVTDSECPVCRSVYKNGKKVRQGTPTPVY